MKTVIKILFLAILTKNAVSQTIVPNKFLWHQIEAAGIENVSGASKLKVNHNTVFVFLSPECPLCKNYMPILNDFSKENSDVQIVGIIPGKSYTSQSIKDFAKDYSLKFDLYSDNKKSLTAVLKAKVTPEVVVLDNSGNIYYRGQIDNWQAKLGTKRKVITEHYLEDALKRLGQKNLKYEETTPIGCLINDL